MKLQDITKKTDAELAELIITTRSELAKAVIESRTKEIKDTKQLGRLKKTIARALTIAREREIAKLEAAQ
ncbi:MAG TPA: 50S ribosomal protein L29 [Candidatus Saccharimonadia bacterium]|nr:50S ribosomal protein L29 [Candidatus Saccharimonadia bacterium]